MAAKIYFSDASTLVVNENDVLIPVTANSESPSEAYKDKPITLYEHFNHGLIPSLLDALCSHPFFFINNEDVVYGSSSIIKIEKI